MLKLDPSLAPKAVTGKRYATSLPLFSVVCIVMLSVPILLTVVGFALRIFPVTIGWILMCVMADGAAVAIMYTQLRRPRSVVILGERELCFFGGKAVPEGGYPDACRVTNGRLLYSDIREIDHKKGRYVQTGYVGIGISRRGEKYVPPKLTLTVDGYNITVYADRSVYRRLQKIRREQGYIS